MTQSRSDLKAAAGSDHRRRRRLSCDPVVQLRAFLEYDAVTSSPGTLPAGVAASHVAAAHMQPLHFAFVFLYVAVAELDAFGELGSRDYTVRGCSAVSAFIMPVSDLLRPRRHTPVPLGQLPAHWPPEKKTLVMDRSPEYVWFL